MKSETSVVVILFAVIVAIQANAHGQRGHPLYVEIPEHGERFKEIIEIDTHKKFGKVVVTKVPSHRGGSLEGVEHVFVPKVGLIFENLSKKKECLIHEPSIGEPSEKETEVAMKHLTGKLPNVGTVSHFNYVPADCEYTIKTDLQLEAAREFCNQGYEQICGQNFPDDEDEEETSKRAVELALAHLGDERKRARLREFIACNPQSTMKIMSCDHSKLVAKCKLTSQFCSYGMLCPLDPKNGEWNCRYNHMFSKLKCCDYDC